MTMSRLVPTVAIDVITDPDQLAKSRSRCEQFDRNAAWLQAHASEVYSRSRGKCICVAGDELFVADSPQEALALGSAAHPDDEGSFVQYVPLERVPRV